jgi:KDO2-lipid IV(A) lauroyltransferase
MIVFSGHIANWEIAMLAGIQHGISVAQIYRAANNPLLDRMIARVRGDGGELIPKRGDRRAARDRGVTPWHPSDPAGRPDE